jgi:hypothetical protein
MIDASIYQLAGAGNPRSYEDYALTAEKIKAERQARQLGALQLMLGQQKADEYTRGVQQQAAVRQLMGTLPADTTDDARVQALRGKGFWSEADALEASRLKAMEVRSKAGKEDAEAKAKLYGLHYQELGAVTNPQQFAQWLERGRTRGIFSIDQVAEGMQHMQTDAVTPQGFEKFLMGAKQAGMTMHEQMQQAAETEKQRREDANKLVTVGPNGPQPNQVAINATRAAATPATALQEYATVAEQYKAQGQQPPTFEQWDLARRKAGAASTTVSMGSPTPVQFTGPDGKPVTAFAQFGNRPGAPPQIAVVTDEDVRRATRPGTRPLMPTKEAGGLNDAQAKANLFGTRAQEADKIIGTLASQGVNQPSFAQQVTGGEGMTGGIATAMANPQQQQVDQAQRDFINAVLRRESGAVISPQEFANARKQYFVQPGDSPQVQAQKARNRQIAVAGILAEVPEGKRGVNLPPMPSSTPAQAPSSSILDQADAILGVK